MDVDVDDTFLESYGEIIDITGGIKNRVSKKSIAEAISDRLMLNEIGNADFRMVKEVKGKLVVYGEPF